MRNLERTLMKMKSGWFEYAAFPEDVEEIRQRPAEKELLQTLAVIGKLLGLFTR
jgi:hypothetical protein